MNSKMTTNSNYQQLNLKNNQKQTKQITGTGTEYRNGDHMEGYQWGEGEGRMGEKVQGIRSISGRYKIGGG